MIGPFDKPAELQIQPIPFELMFQLAEKQQARRDKSEQELGALQGAFASLQEAPGHEDYKRKALSPYQDAIKNFMNKYQDPSDPRAVRELSALKSSFMSDPHIQNIHNSKQTYDKLMPELYKAKQTDAVFTSPVMNKQGEFQPNEQLYTPDKLSFIPQADINPEIDKDLAKVSPYIHQNNFLPSIRYMTGPNGEKVPIIQQGQTVHERKSYAEFNKSIDAIVDNILQQNTDASRWFIPKNDQGDPVKTRAYVKQYVTNKAISYFYDNEKTDLSFSQFNGGDKEETNNVTATNIPEQQQVGVTGGLGKTIQDRVRGRVYGGFVPVGKKEPGKIYDGLTRVQKLTTSKLAGDLGITSSPSSWTDVEWNKIKTMSDSIDEGTKTSAIQVTDDSKKVREEKGAKINVIKQNYLFFNPETGKSITGYQLGKEGFEIIEDAGTISTFNVIPQQIAGQEKYTFASPRVMIAKNKDGVEIPLYMGRNRAELNKPYKVGLLNNRIAQSLQTGVPTAITEYNDDIIIIPGSDPQRPYSFTLDMKGEQVLFPYDTYEAFQEGVIRLLNDENLEKILDDALYTSR